VNGFNKKTWLTGGLTIVCLLSVFLASDVYHPIGTANIALLVLTIGSALLITAVAVFLPRHLKNFKPSVNILLTVYSMMLLLYPLLIWINVTFDQTDMVSQRLSVREKHPSQLKGETYVVSFYLPQSRQIDASGYEDVEIERAEYNRVDLTETYVHLELRSGAIGIPWLQSFWLEFPKNRK
jgi:hypothetical protein